MPDRITIPAVIERFKEYHRRNGAWGILHIVLDDGNVRDDFVRFCIAEAESAGDAEGKELGEILMGMSKTQRSKIGRMV